MTNYQLTGKDYHDTAYLICVMGYHRNITGAYIKNCVSYPAYKNNYCTLPNRLRPSYVRNQSFLMRKDDKNHVYYDIKAH